MSRSGNPLPDVPPAPCPQCDGLGWYNEMGPNTFAQTCRACQGTGERSTICLDCQGDGRVLSGVYPGGTDTCDRCRGKGRLPA